MNLSTHTVVHPQGNRDLNEESKSVTESVDQQHAWRLQQVQQLAKWMDTSFSVPGTPIRFGWDSIIGFIPGIGDAFTALAGGWIIREAHRSGAPKLMMVKMVGNVAVDMTTGIIPLVGDLFDVYWKSNLCNAKLLEQHLHRSKPK